MYKKPYGRIEHCRQCRQRRTHHNPGMPTRAAHPDPGMGAESQKKPKTAAPTCAAARSTSVASSPSVVGTLTLTAPRSLDVPRPMVGDGTLSCQVCVESVSSECARSHFASQTTALTQSATPRVARRRDKMEV